MKRTFLTLLLTLGLTLSAHALTQNQDTRAMPKATIQKMDRQMTRYRTHTRNFNSHEEYKRKQQIKMKRTMHRNMRYNNGYTYNSGYHTQAYQESYHQVKQRGYRHTKRGWILAYRYDRASFYDNEGYFYGYFNRYGYYFNDVFYRYDRHYTYQDRVRGRGLFNRLYYMPVNARYYGFEIRNHHNHSI